MKTTLSFLTVLVFAQVLQAQELQAKFTVLSNKVSTQVDKKVFQTMQTALTNFIYMRLWTCDTYQAQEKI